MEANRKENEDPLSKLSTDHNICEVYLAKRGLSVVPDLSTFSQLKFIWLNDNRIKDIRRNMFICCLAELYLQNNEITSISGALRHLNCLRVLLLHNNQLTKLEEAVSELRNMHCLQTVNFFLNPFTQDPEYRHYVIHHLPSVQILDRKEVRQEERTHAFRLFSPERQMIMAKLAFGREALARTVGRKVIKDPLNLKGSHGFRQKHTNHPCDETEKHPQHRSYIQFSILDWCSIRTAQQSPLEEQNATAANILTVKLT